MIFNEF